MLKIEKLATETGAIRAIIQCAWLQKLETFIYYQRVSFLMRVYSNFCHMFCVCFDLPEVRSGRSQKTSAAR